VTQALVMHTFRGKVDDLPVITKMILAAKSLATDVTFIRTFVRMCSFVYQQVVRLGEMATTESTDKLASTIYNVKN